MLHRVAFLGFSDFERNALSSYFRLAHNRSPSYEQVPTLTDADFLVADADHGPSVQLVLAIERLPETVFVGAHEPPGCAAWTMRPIDALHVMGELDTLVARALAARVPRIDADGPQTTIIQLARRREAEAEAAQTTQTAHTTQSAQTVDAVHAANIAESLLGDLPFDTPETADPQAHPLTLRDLPLTAPNPAPIDITWPDDEGFVPVQGPMPIPAPVPSRPAPHEPMTEQQPQRPQRRLRLPTPADAEMPVGDGFVVGGPAMPAAQAKPTVTAAPAATSAARAPKAPRAEREARPAPTPRVLLVDDSAIAQRFLETRLARWKLDIDRATNSQTAVALLARHSYDIVFLDVELGEQSELDGLTLCQRIKHTPALMSSMVVMVSAHHSELDRVRGALAGCDAYLAKPLDDAELQRLMKRQGVPAATTAAGARSV